MNWKTSTYLHKPPLSPVGCYRDGRSRSTGLVAESAGLGLDWLRLGVDWLRLGMDWLRLGVDRLRLGRPAERRQHLGQLAEAGRERGPVAVRISHRELTVDPGSLLLGRDGIVELADVTQPAAEIAEGASQVGPVPDGVHSGQLAADDDRLLGWCHRVGG